MQLFVVSYDDQLLPTSQFCYICRISDVLCLWLQNNIIKYNMTISNITNRCQGLLVRGWAVHFEDFEFDYNLDTPGRQDFQVL